MHVEVNLEQYKGLRAHTDPTAGQMVRKLFFMEPNLHQNTHLDNYDIQKVQKFMRI